MAVVLIIIFAVIVFIWVSASGKARARMHYANERGAERDTQEGIVRQPTWMDTAKEKVFFEQVVDIAKNKGVSKTYVMKGFMSPEAAQALFSHVAHMETRGSSFTEQVISGANFVAGAWDELPREKQQEFLAKDRLGVLGLMS